MRKTGFTLIELLVVVAIIAVLVSILLPAIARARLNARSAVCLANCRSIAQGIVIYSAGSNDVLPVMTESPYDWSVHGPRTTPLILRDEKILPIANDQGGVWRCPLDARTYKAYYLAWYYYFDGGGRISRSDATSGMTDEELMEATTKGSYSGNAVYRMRSSRSPFSYWGDSFQARQLATAPHPSTTILFFDSCWNWDADGNSPYQMFYTWATLDPRRDQFEQFWRHNPANFGPSGNAGFLDGHAEAGVDYLGTCCNDDYSENPQKSAHWWSFTGE